MRRPDWTTCSSAGGLFFEDSSWEPSRLLAFTKEHSVQDTGMSYRHRSFYPGYRFEINIFQRYPYLRWAAFFKSDVTNLDRVTLNESKESVSETDLSWKRLTGAYRLQNHDSLLHSSGYLAGPIGLYANARWDACTALNLQGESLGKGSSDLTSKNDFRGESMKDQFFQIIKTGQPLHLLCALSLTSCRISVQTLRTMRQ
jgi:hypothetical protein